MRIFLLLILGNWQYFFCGLPEIFFHVPFTWVQHPLRVRSIAHLLMQFGILILANRLWKLLLEGVLLDQKISFILVFISGSI
jgi:hypothetical protein